MNAFMTIKHGHDDLGTLHIELYHETCPLTVKNFMSILEGVEGPSGQRLTYRNSICHRLVPGFMAQFGDITKGDGTGGESIYGPNFDDESFVKQHDRKGILSMANSGPNTNASQFFVTFRKTPHLDSKHVVFGHIDLEKSDFVLRKLEKVKTDKSDRPFKPVVIVDCGVLLKDDDNTNLAEEIVGDGNQNQKVSREDFDLEDDEHKEEPEEEEGSVSKAQAIRNRLRTLKMKMNQARQLNRKALQKEGEAMGSEEGKARQRNQHKKQEKKMKQEAWQAHNARAVEFGKETGVDAKYLVEPASLSLARTISLTLMFARDKNGMQLSHLSSARSLSILLSLLS